MTANVLIFLCVHSFQLCRVLCRREGRSTQNDDDRMFLFLLTYVIRRKRQQPMEFQH